ncbi:MAG TPA: endolytic transglycosylase MltG [Rhizomicrobium sp.]|jgi:UPF0755 protein
MNRIIAILIAVAVIVAGVFEWESANFNTPGLSAKETVVLIPPHSGVSAISQTLEDAHVIKHAHLFWIGVRLRGEAAALKAGEYAIPAKASLRDVAAILMSGKVVQHKLTAAEGLTSQMIYNIVKKDSSLEGSAGTIPEEGVLLPETYLFTHGTTRNELLARMKAAQTTLFAKLWSARAADLPYQTQAQALILASIVEKESAIPSERRHIASVFVNRLRIGMPLQSDPTIIYGITRGYPLGRAILESEIKAPTPFNTYAIAGLPPLPICNPGSDSIAAVLNPDQSPDLYFVADGTGGHVFSATIAEHEKNVAKWRKIHDQQKLSPPAP